MGDDRTSDADLDEAPEVLALRAEVARVRTNVIPAMKAKQEAINLSLGGRRRRRSSPFAMSAMQMNAAPVSTRK